tara:strand:+ start:7493 stop:9361 length:1869 start_codon:yes stop_codon:yes gene_type:complete
MATRKAIALVSGLFQEVNTPTDGLDFAGNDTDDLSEGSSNQYFTTARARSAISVTDSGGDGSLGYNSSTGVITYLGPSPSEVRAHLSVATGSGLTYNSTSGEFGTNAIPNSQLANSSLTLGSTSISLGGTATTVAGLTSLTSTTLEGSTTVRVGAADAANGILLNSSGITFEGSSADANETVLTVANPTADRTLTLPDNTGTILSTGSSIANSNLANSDITVGSTSISLGATATTIAGLTSLTSTTLEGTTTVRVGAADAANGLLLNSSGITFEGSSANAHETTLSVTDPTADRSIVFPDAGGTVALLTSLSVATGSGLTYNNGTGEFGTSAIPNSQLANSSITIGTSAVSLGSSTLTLAGLTSVTSAAVVTNDGGFRVRNTTDNTKQLAFALSGITTSTTRTLTVQDVNDTIVVLGTDQTFTGNNTFRNSSGQRFEQAATNDGVVINGRGGGSNSYAVTLTPEALGANRTIVLPNAGGTVSLRDVNETISGTKTFTASNTFRNASGQRFEQASTQDAILINGRGGGSSSRAITLTPAALADNRTITVPDETGTLLTSASTIPGGTFVDNTFRISDNSDSSKKLAFECSGITASNTRTMTVPDTDGTISTESFATAIAVALG